MNENDPTRLCENEKQGLNIIKGIFLAMFLSGSRFQFYSKEFAVQLYTSMFLLARIKIILLETMLLQSSSHIPQLAAGVNSLLTRGKLLDMTLAAGGKSIKVHKVVMAAASKYFEDLLLSQEEHVPVIFFRDVSFIEMECLVRYIYTGEVEVAAPALQSFLSLAHSLGVSGFAENIGANSTLDKTPTKRKLDWGLTDNTTTAQNNVAATPTIDTSKPIGLTLTDGVPSSVMRTPLKPKFVPSQPSTPKSYSEPASLLETVLQCSNSKKRKLHTQSLTDNLENIDPNFLSMSSFKNLMLPPAYKSEQHRTTCDHNRDEPLATPHNHEYYHSRCNDDIISGSGGSKPSLERTDSNATVRIKPSPVKDRANNHHMPSSSLPVQSPTPPASKTTPKSAGSGNVGGGASNFSFDSHFLDPDELAAKGATLLHHLAVWMIQQRKEGPQHYYHGSGFVGDEMPSPKVEESGINPTTQREAKPLHATTKPLASGSISHNTITRHATSSLPATTSSAGVRSSFYSSQSPVPSTTTTTPFHHHHRHNHAKVAARKSLLSGSGDADRPDSGFDSKDDSKDDQEESITILKKDNSGVTIGGSSGSSPEIGEISRQTFSRQPVKKKRVLHHNII